MKRTTKWGLGVGATIVVAGAFWSVSDGSGVVAEVIEVRRDTMSVTVDGEGRTRVRDLFSVAAPVAGRLSRPEVDEGTLVEAGDILTTVAPAPDDPRVRAARLAEVESAEAGAERAGSESVEAMSRRRQAVREAERRRPLHEMGAISNETMEQFEEAAEQATLNEQAAQAALRSAGADLRLAEARLLGGAADSPSLEGVPVRAPVAGAVLRVIEESERVVQAGSPLFQMANPSGLEIVVDVLTEDAVQVEPGDPIRVTGWGGDETLHGTVRLVEPSAFTEISALGVEEQRVNVIGRLPSAPAGMGVGYRLDAAIVVWEGVDILSVPTGSLFQRSGTWHVFVVTDGKAELRQLEIGRRGAERAEVVGGLEQGERVILFPSDLVGDGVSVRIEEAR